jgi:hypothetical protein
MSLEDQKKFLETLATIKFPHGFIGYIQKNIIENKWGCMKLHDFHVFMQQILHVCFCHKMYDQPQIVVC